MKSARSFRAVTVGFRDGRRLVGPLDVTLFPGRVHGVVGESGSGKTLTLRALAGVTPRNLESSWQCSDGPVPRTAMIFQDPAGFFNPRWRVDRSLREVLVHVRKLARRTVAGRISELAELVGLSSAELHRYPFELSGGMVQRAGIAMALATEPELLLADEITSALDPERGDKILQLLRAIAVHRGLSVVFVSHDLPLVARAADDVHVLYEGQLVEYGPPARVLADPRHQYTALLVNSLPSRERRGEPLPEIPLPREGVLAAPEACPFLPRCPAATSACRVMPAWDAEHRYRCHNPVQGVGR
ncbi:MAG: oligopeptide/dipeptide ABC transporter ATP-binding protein [Alkalispirochaeta sp.]